MSSLETAMDRDTSSAHSHHVIDRTFIYAGERWIIDYKTHRANGPEALSEHVLQNMATSHKPQLERYAALFASEGLKIRTAIFFPSHGKLIEV